ncbi:hypothetical protein TIFTF001_016522 [Ficus carica]|uniref:Uncharacterized protein n=1 Tax=Ficus carica TaxID=3494 RepID=A0AA88A7Q3_FICCA|nr:hypothetical protein TIFTF001_016522 [Ficus carica]
MKKKFKDDFPYSRISSRAFTHTLGHLISFRSSPDHECFSHTPPGVFPMSHVTSLDSCQIVCARSHQTSHGPASSANTNPPHGSHPN